MAKNNVLIVDAIHQKGLEVFENSGFKAWSLSNKDQADIIDALSNDIDAVVVRTSKINSTMMDAAQNLKIIGRHGTGLDNIDVSYATEKGIAVVNTPHANTMSVVEYVIGAVFWFAKGFLYCDQMVKQGEWSFRENFQPVEVQGQTIGVVGFGGIGRETSRLMAALGLKVLVYDPFIDANTSIPEYVTVVDELSELLKVSDYVTLHIPLTEQTKDLITMDELKQMKNDAILINGARGGVVSEQDLSTALRDRIIRGAAVDVFEKEPPEKDNPLFEHDNVVLTPHNCSLTEAAKVKAATTVAREIVNYINGERPEYIVNPEVYSR